jgi:hypothetical protein
MKRNKTLRLYVLGFITWLIPFVISFAFYDRTGNLNVNYGLFKCIMVVTSSLTGMYVMMYHFKYVNSSYFREGVIAGLLWLVINILLDLVILVPMAGMTLTSYFTTIGLGYLQIPIICIAVGTILQRKVAT